MPKKYYLEALDSFSRWYIVGSFETSAAARKCTADRGPWFDGYQQESGQ